jgi:DNA-binding beta-propeller fold protein YncE
LNRRLFRSALLGFVVAFFSTACGGGGGSIQSVTPPTIRSSAAPVSPQAATTVQFSITFPATSTSSSSSSSIRRRLVRRTVSVSGRGRDYVSPGILSLGITINGGSPTYINAPTDSPNTPTTITETVPAAPGNDTFFISEYDQTNGGGDLLGKVTQTSNVIAGTANVINITVNGQLASIMLQPATTPFIEGSLSAGYTLIGDAPQTFMAVPLDAKGYTIVSPGLVPSIAISSATPASIAVAQPQTGSNTFTLQAPAPTAFVTITASGNALSSDGTTDSGATITSTIKVDALAAFYIADYFVQQVKVFDENGVPLALPATSFANVLNPMGLAEVPPSASNPTGSIILTETSNFPNPALPDVVAFDEAGNPQSLPSTAFPNVSQPVFLSYGAGQLFLPDFNTATVTIYDTTGTQAPTATGSFPGLLNPVAALYDPDNGDVYVTNFGADSITQYSATGKMIATATTGSHPQGIAYDSVGKNIFVAYGGSDGGVLNAANTPASVTAPTNSGIDEFTPALASVTIGTGDFNNTNPNSFFTGIAFDPYTKQFYVGDSGQSTIDAFSEAGAAVTLPTGAFDTINATGVVPSDPQQILFVP